MPDAIIPVQRTRIELTKINPTYRKIEDALVGVREIKKDSKTEDYLPLPSTVNSINDSRYKAYRTRAVYYNVIEPTLNALVGQLFLQPFHVELPSQLAGLEQNMNGEGTQMEEVVRVTARHIIPYGRGGYLTDFPETDGAVTAADLQNGVQPMVKFYPPWAIRNWRVETKKNKEKLVMLVLDEAYEETNSNDPFNVETKIYQRAYVLTEGACKVTLTNEEGQQVAEYDLKDSNGQPLSDIPFSFIGAENNSPEIDEPPFEPLAELNLAHYRNSADYEESVFMMGQPTLFISGMTDDWMNNHHPTGFVLGSRAALTGPAGSNAELLQVQSNLLAFEAMTHKEDQMFSIGGKIIDRKQTVEKKEAEVEMEAASQQSVLLTIKQNIEKALRRALEFAGMFVGVEITDDNLKIELNEIFDLDAMSPDELRMAMELASQETPLLSRSEVREVLLRNGMARLELEEFETEVKAFVAERAAQRKAEQPEPSNNPNPANN